MGEAFHITHFVPAFSTEPGAVTRFGGQPSWMAETEWPVSQSTGKPLRFVGQVDLDTPPFRLGKMAYLFAEIYDADLDRYFEDNWSVILQAKSGAGVLNPQGPSASEMVWHVKGAMVSEPDWSAMEAEGTGLANQRNWEGFEEFMSRYGVVKIGGSPVTPEDMHPLEESQRHWHLLLQLPEREENGTASDLPFYMDYGDGGMGWFLLSPDLQRSHFLWTSG